MHQPRWPRAVMIPPMALGTILALTSCDNSEPAATTQATEDRAAAEYQREAVAADHAQVRAEHERVAADHERMRENETAGSDTSGGSRGDDKMTMGGMNHDSMGMGGSSTSAKSDAQPKSASDQPMPMKDEM